MNSDYPVDLVPATPDFVLRVFQGWVRHSKACFYTDQDFELTNDTTIDEFRLQLDLLPWRQLATGYNEDFEIDCKLSEWKEVLTPEKKRTVGQLCEFLAKRIREPRIRPLHIAGVTCGAAGAFLSMKSMLVADGANPDSIYPSAPIEPFLQRHFKLFFGPISRLAPGAMPELIVEADDYALLLFAAGLGLMAALVGGKPVLVLLCILKLVVIISGWFMPNRSVSKFEMRSVSTFRDLSLWIAHVHEQRDGAVTASA